MNILDFMYEYEYIVGYKKKDWHKYRYIYPSARYWYADPLLAEFDNETYLFLEAYDKLKGLGRIAVATYDHDKDCFLRPQVILTEPFHLSFPYVFSYKGQIYMLPEANESREFRLYQMGNSVFDWHLYSTAVMDKEYTDVAVYVYVDSSTREEKIVLFAGEKDPHDPLKCKTVIMRLNDIKTFGYDIVFEEQDYSFDDRNGGRIKRIQDGILQRVFQHSSADVYGLYITLETVDYNEKTEKYNRGEDACMVVDLSKERIHLKNSCLAYGIHTFSYSDILQVLDIGVKRLSVDGLFYKLRRRLWGRRDFFSHSRKLLREEEVD